MIGRILALEIGIHRQDHLTHFTVAHALQEFVDTQVFRANAVQGRKRSMKHMIQSLVNPGLLQRKHIERFFHNADKLLVAIRVATGNARIGFGNIETARAIDNALFDAHDSFSQATSLVARTAKNEERETLGRLYANTRQFLKFFDKCRHRRRDVAHSLEESWNFHASSKATAHFLLCFSYLIMGIFGSSQYHHLKIGNIFRSKSFRVDLDSSDLKFAIHGDGNSTTTGSAGKLTGFELLLHFNESLLHLLDFTHVHSKIAPYFR